MHADKFAWQLNETVASVLLVESVYKPMSILRCALGSVGCAGTIIVNISNIMQQCETQK